MVVQHGGLVVDIHQRLLNYQVDALVLWVLHVAAESLVGLQLLAGKVLAQEGHGISLPAHRPWMRWLDARKPGGQLRLR